MDRSSRIVCASPPILKRQPLAPPRITLEHVLQLVFAVDNGIVVIPMVNHDMIVLAPRDLLKDWRCFARIADPSVVIEFDPQIVVVQELAPLWITVIVGLVVSRESLYQHQAQAAAPTADSSTSLRHGHPIQQIAAGRTISVVK